MPSKARTIEQLKKSNRPQARRLDNRPNAAERGYDARWQRFRKWFLADASHCICHDCGVHAAVEVHHLQTVRDRPDLQYDEANCLGLCKSCHSRRTAASRQSRPDRRQGHDELPSRGIDDRARPCAHTVKG